LRQHRQRRAGTALSAIPRPDGHPRRPRTRSVDGRFCLDADVPSGWLRALGSGGVARLAAASGALPDIVRAKREIGKNGARARTNQARKSGPYLCITLVAGGHSMIAFKRTIL